MIYFPALILQLTDTGWAEEAPEKARKERQIYCWIPGEVDVREIPGEVDVRENHPHLS